MAPGPISRSRYSISELKRDLKEHLKLDLSFNESLGRLSVQLRWVDDPDDYLAAGDLLIQDHIYLHIDNVKYDNKLVMTE